MFKLTASIILQSQFSASFTLKYRLLSGKLHFLFNSKKKFLACNRSIEIEDNYSILASGRLTSPNYPNAYEHDTKCLTKISVPINNLIFLVFKDFQMESGRRLSSRYNFIKKFFFFKL